MDQGPDAPQGQSIDSIRQSSGTLGPMVIHENYEDGANHKVYSSPSVHPILQEAPNHSCPVAVSINLTTSLTRGDNMIEAFGEVSSTPSVPPILSDSNPDSSQGSSFLAELQKMIDSRCDHRIGRPPPDPSMFEEVQTEELNLCQQKLNTMSQLERMRLDVSCIRSREAAERGEYYMDQLLSNPRSLHYEEKMREAEKHKRKRDETQRKTRLMREQTRKNAKLIEQMRNAIAKGQDYMDGRPEDETKGKK